MHWYTYNDLWFSFRDHSKQSVIGANYILPVVKSQQEVTTFVVKKIYKYNMKAILREVANSVSAYISCLGIVEWSKVMAYINYSAPRNDLQQLSLNGSCQIIFLTDI